MTTTTLAGASTETTTPLLSDITPLDVARRALELADANPEHKAGVCYYVSDPVTGNLVDEGICIFGQALVSLGMDPLVLRRFENQSIDHIFAAGFDPEVAPEKDVIISDLGYAQWAQDEGVEWGDEQVRGKLAEFIEAAQ